MNNEKEIEIKIKPLCGKKENGEREGHKSNQQEILLRRRGNMPCRGRTPRRGQLPNMQGNGGADQRSDEALCQKDIAMKEAGNKNRQWRIDESKIF